MNINSRPFTYEEAIDIAEDFVDLEGGGIFIETDDMNIACNVDLVVVTPNPEAEQKLFLQNVASGQNPEEALTSYNGDSFDVLILGNNADGETFQPVVIPIRLYTASYGIPYKYP